MIVREREKRTIRSSRPKHSPTRRPTVPSGYTGPLIHWLRGLVDVGLEVGAYTRVLYRLSCRHGTWAGKPLSLPHSVAALRTALTSVG
jgi:hypothetical protein